ncbi:MAG: hypothetical protein Q4B41_10640, partial [Corynebacterium sp.]|nr:hypothetical protein [Corynebacterium sp.]
PFLTSAVIATTAALVATPAAIAAPAAAPDGVEPAADAPAQRAPVAPGSLGDLGDLAPGSLASDALDQLRDAARADGPGAERALADLIESIRLIESGEIGHDGLPANDAGRPGESGSADDAGRSGAPTPARTAPLADFGSSGDDADDESDGGRAPWLDADGEEDEPVAYRDDVTEKKDFWLPALVPSCGVEGSLATTAKATVQPGPNYGAGPIFGDGNLAAPYIPSGHAFYHLFTRDIRLAPVVDGTDVTVMWFNLTERKGGSAKLDDSVLGLGINSQTSKLVETGEGAVVAVIYGTVRYAGNGNSCTVLPTIGSVQVG